MYLRAINSTQKQLNMWK